MEFGRRECILCGSCLDDLQIFATKFCVASGPRLKSANAVEDFFGGAGKIYEAVFLRENRRKAGLRVVLGARVNGSSFQATQGRDHQIGANGGQARGESFRSVVRRN